MHGHDRVINMVMAYIENRLDGVSPRPSYDIFIVWFSKTLQNRKWLISTTLQDGMYYEVTYNGDKGETYLDAYKKVENICIKDTDTVHDIRQTLAKPSSP